MMALYSGAQTNFYKFYGGNGYDFAHGIDEREDSSYLVTGSTSSFAGNAQMFIMSLDKYGEHQWTLDYGGPETDIGRRIFYVQGYGIYVAGYGNSFGEGGFDAYLMFTDLSGNEIWTQTYGTEGRERVNDAALTIDTGLFMVGETKAFTENENIFIIRTDKNGDTLWTKVLGGFGADVATCVERIDDTTYLVGGYEYIADSLLTKGVIYTILDDGTVLDKKVFGSSSDCKILDMTYINNQLDVVGTTLGPTDWDNMRWDLTMPSMSLNNEYTGTGDLKEMNAICYADNGINRFIAFSVEGPSVYPDGPDIYIGLFTAELVWIPLGNPLVVAYIGVDDVGQMIPTLDKGFVVVGSSYASDSEYSKAYVVKVGPGIDYPAVDPSVNTIVGFSELESFETSVYPVPVRENLIIESDKMIRGVKIYDQFGRALIAEVCNNMQQVQLKVSDLVSGSYVLTVEFEDGQIGQKRIVIE